MAEITRKRTGEFLRRLFSILLQSPEGLAASRALEQLADSVTMTSYEAGTYESGTRRFEKIVRFATVDCVKAGWLLKHKGVWAVTAVGREAYSRFPEPEAFYREAVRLYKAWRVASRTQGAVADVADHLIEENGSEKTTGITFETAEEQASAEIEQYVSVMNPFDFQALVAALLKAMAYYISWISPPGKDGGVDIIAHTDPLGTRVPRVKVQVKRVGQKVDKDGLKSFMAIVNEDDVGLFVSTAGFTRDAEEFARVQERRKITLIDLDRLVDLWIQFYPKLDDSARSRLPLTPIYFLTPPV